MTLGIGFRCPEGVLLVTDSLLIKHAPDREDPFWERGNKRYWLGRKNLAVLVSGTVPEDHLLARDCDLMPYPNIDRALRFDPVAETHQLFGQLRVIDRECMDLARQGGMISEQDYREDMARNRPQVMVAGHPDSEEPQLILATSWSGLEEAPPGAVLTLGGWLECLPPDVTEELQAPAPDTMAEALDRAASWVRRTVASVRAGGRFPYFGFPLVATGFNEINHYWEVAE